MQREASNNHDNKAHDHEYDQTNNDHNGQTHDHDNRGTLQLHSVFKQPDAVLKAHILLLVFGL